MAEKKERITLPEGIAVWPKLDVVDVYKPKKGPEKRRYVTDIEYDDVTLKKLQDAFRKKAKELLPEVKDPKLPFKTDKKTGKVYLTASSGEKYKPPAFDAKNNRLPDGVAVGGGSVLKLNVSINAYDTGVNQGINLYINAVQVLKLIEKGTGTSPFEEAEGFTHDGGDESNTFDSVDDKKDGKGAFEF